MREPVPSMDRILQFLNQPPGESKEHTAWNTDKEHNHIIKANPSKFSETLRLQPDQQWKNEMTTRDKAVVTGISLPLLLKYGYKLRT